MELLNVTVPEGGFKPAPDLQGSPVSDEQVLENIRASTNIDAPVFVKQQRREGSYIFVAGGPSTLDNIEEIKKRKENGEFICTSNKTYDFLIEHGIIADACIVLDPKEIVGTYITKPQKETIFFIAVVCHPSVANNLLKAGMKVYKMLIGYGIDEEKDVELQRLLYPEYKNFLCGGTMTGLRAMNFAPLLGFYKVEYYGFDSCFSSKIPNLIKEDDPSFREVVKRNKGISYEDSETGKCYTIDEVDGGFFYAYKKKRGENIQIAQTPDGRRFYTSPCFAHQAKQAIKWIDRLEDRVEIIIHGDNLTSALLKCHREAKAKISQNIGDKRWTPEYKNIQCDFHKTHDYGVDGDGDAEMIGRAILGLIHNLNRKFTLLDYGCGNCFLIKRLNFIFNCIECTSYDPFLEEHSKEPEGIFDITTCLDVMEHVEEQCVENTLKYIADRTKYLACFEISLNDAIKILPDGRNAHITQHSIEWWSNRIKKYFDVVELFAISGVKMLVVCQTFGAAEELQKEVGVKVELQSIVLK